MRLVTPLMKRRVYSYLIIGLIFMATSCTTHTKTPVDSSVIVDYAGTEKLPNPIKQTTTNEPISVYRNPTIEVVTLRSHIDELGRLLGPQIMYQITDPGGWNLDAIEQSGAVISTSRAQQNKLNTLDSNQLQLIDAGHIEQVVITGYMDPKDRDKAEILRGSTHADFGIIYDAETGWLLLPRSSL
jgi:hypothetical protein